jgi:hypothetical protein
LLSYTSLSTEKERWWVLLLEKQQLCIVLWLYIAFGLPSATRSSFLSDQFTNIEGSKTGRPLLRTVKGGGEPSRLLEECGERVNRLVQLGFFLDAYPKIYMLVM